MKKTIEREFGNNDFRVTIFGSARLKKNSREYKEVKKLAKHLAEQGIDIVTGVAQG